MVWTTSYDPSRERFELVAYDSAGHRARSSESLLSRPFAYGMTAASAGIAVYGWDSKKTEGLVQWVGYDGKLGARWTYPGNVSVAKLGAHADGSVTLLFSIFGQATVYGHAVTGPPVDGDSSARGTWVAARVASDGAARWLRVIPEKAERRRAGVGLVTGLDGRGGIWWDQASPGVRGGGLLLWDQVGSGSWEAPLRSVQAAAIDSLGTLIAIGGEDESPPPEGRGGNVAPGDSPVVMERWQRGTSTRHQICRTACARHPQLATDPRGRHYLLAQFGDERFLDWPVASRDSWVLVAFEGERALGCASLDVSSAQLLVGADGSLWVITQALEAAASVNGGAVGSRNEISLLRFELDRP